MNRPLKFRQWAQGKFYYWGVGIDDSTFVVPVSGGGINATNTIHHQFTGMCDRSGNEIYEGDVVRDEDGNIAEVIWNPEHSQFQVDFVDELQGLGGDISVWGEVVGNVFEHPHLLKTEERYHAT